MTVVVRSWCCGGGVAFLLNFTPEFIFATIKILEEYLVSETKHFTSKTKWW